MTLTQGSELVGANRVVLEKDANHSVPGGNRFLSALVLSQNYNAPNVLIGRFHVAPFDDRLYIVGWLFQWLYSLVGNPVIR